MGVKLRRFVFDNDKEIQRKLREEIKTREVLSRKILGNLKYIGPDGNMYIGPRF